MTITVTQEHVDKGNPGVSNECALALAFISAGFPDVRVRTDGVWPYGYGIANEEIGVELPETADGFRFAFDRCLEVKPFTFEMDIPTC